MVHLIPVYIYFWSFSGQEDGSDDDECDSSSDDENEIGEEKVIAEFCQVSSNIGGGAPLGDWEKHTKVLSEFNNDTLKVLTPFSFNIAFYVNLL